MVKNEYYGNECLSLAWDLSVIFLGVPNLRFDEVKKNWSFGSKGVIEKCESCFLVYLFLEVSIFIKKWKLQKKWSITGWKVWICYRILTGESMTLFW